MSKWPTHPEEAALVRLVDGELPAEEACEIERHLEACPACRAEVDDLRDTVADCHRYRSEVLENLLPPPPAPWADFDELVGRPVVLPVRRRAPVLRWVLGAAAAVALTVGVLQQLRETPSVQAATLLHKAEAAAATRPAARRRLLIRTRTVQYTRLAGVAGTLPQEPAAPALEALFQQAHWDWNDPLSARAFDAWREPLSHKTDSVTSAADTVEIRTGTPEGSLASASLTLRAGDLSPVSGRLEFRNQDWVEMSEIPDGQPQSDAASPAPRPAEPAAHAPEVPGTPSSIPDNALFSSELHALLKLHEMKADLGDPVDVSTAGGRVLVTGHAGLSRERQLEIQVAMHAIPNVTVEFSESAPAPAVAEPPPAAATTSQPVAPGGIPSRVERQLGGRPQFERFSAQMLDWTDEAMSRAYALRRLAEHFPPAPESSLDAADRRALRAVAREHAAALATVAGKMMRTLSPVLTALGGEAAGGGPVRDAWQSTAEDLLSTARRTDKNVSVMLGATRGDDAAFSASELMRDLARLVSDSARCQRLLAQE